MTIYLARYLSRNFTFEAFGKSKEEALKTLLNGLLLHAEQYDLDPDWWKKYEDDLHVQEFKTSIAYRDGRVMKELIA